MRQSIWFCFIIVFFLTGCSQLTRLETGRTLGKSGISVGGSLANYSVFPNGSGDLFDSRFLPYAQVDVGFGIFDRMDLSASASSAGNLLVVPKFQFVGDQQSKFAMSVLPGLEFQAGGEQNVINRQHISLIASVHPNEKFAVFVEPKYIYQGVDKTHFPGGTLGVNFKTERNWNFGIGTSFFPIISGDMENTQNKIFMVSFGVHKVLNRSK